MTHIWGFTNTTWANASWTWAELEVITEVIFDPGVDADLLVPYWVKKPVTEEEKRKKKTLIIMICKVRGYKEKEQSREIQEDIEIVAEDIDLLLKTVRPELKIYPSKYI